MDEHAYDGGDWMRAHCSQGLSRRDLFAAAALTGLLADDVGYTPQQMAKEAVAYADALLAALDQPKGETP